MYCEFAHWYDKMMHTVDYDRWTAYIEQILKENCCHSVFECGCGTGNISLNLARHGYSVFASDISEDMLMETRNKMMKAGLRFPIVLQDMQSIQIHKQIDAIVSACDGVNYLVDGPEHFFSTAYKALKPGGILLFDISSEYKLSKTLNSISFSDIGDDWAYICDCEYNNDSSLLNMDLTCFVKQNSFYKRFEENHYLRAYSTDDIKKMLLANSFREIRFYDCFTFDAPSESSERIQVIAKKPF